MPSQPSDGDREPGRSMHVAIISHELTSRFNTSLEFADRIAAAGHRVTYLTHADVSDSVAAHGHAFRRLTGPPASPSRLRLPSLGSLVPWVRSSLRTRTITAADEEIERAVAEIEPDIIAIDIEMFYAVLATTRVRVPVVLYMNFFSLFRIPGIPPLNSAFVPSGSPDDARRIRRLWRRNRLETWRRQALRKLGPALIGDVLRPIPYGTNSYADLKSIARTRSIDLRSRSDRRQGLDPLMFMDVPILAFTAREMDFPHEPHPNMRYVGPMIPDRRREARLDETSRALWDRFVEGIGDKPMVYCSLGSFLTDVDFLRKVVDVFRRRHDWQLVMGLGRMASRADLGDVPDNVLVLDWAPQLEVLAHADVAITHGGTSTIHECIVNGVPVLVCPPNRPDLDQTGNAARVVYHGLGLRGAFDSDTSQDIERNIERLLTDRHFTESLREMLTVFDRYRMDDVGVRTLEAEYEARRSA